ncbi:MAG: hypothetical protein WCE23_02960 [Candidatus Binatus sp.]|uniref:hypothetical protein n=1 Tax=Candidatus Binatus sp. TaxID=2811406 RepID=UPI003C73DC39
MAIREIADVVGAEKYMREQLTDGTTIAHLVLNRIDLSRGKFRIAMPDIVDQNPPFDFKSDRRLDGDEEMAVARVIKSFISDPNCVVLMQETQIGKSDRFSTESWFLEKAWQENLALNYKDELYWPVAGPEFARISDEEMLGVVRSASAYPFSAFLYVGTVPSSKTLTDRDLERILTKLVGVTVDAFDGRSFLLWWRDEVRFP